MASGTKVAVLQTEREAKEYLVARIVAEAQLEDVPLSDIERKMLYFSETGWTLPGMLEINAEFERDYDNEEYEQKIAELVRRIEKRNEAAGGDEQSMWDDAVVKLSDGDHYLLVLIRLGRSAPPQPHSKWLPTFEPVSARPRGDFLRLIAVAFALLLAMGLLVWLKDRWEGR